MIFDSLPSQFCLQDLCAVTGRVFELRVNPHQAEADRVARAWFNRYVYLAFCLWNSQLTLVCSIGLYDDRKRSKFINYGKFDLFAALTFPDADVNHLITSIMFYFWAFSVRLSSVPLVPRANDPEPDRRSCRRGRVSVQA